jgi:hypothetical protein
MDDGVLVAAETRQEVGLADAGAQALRDRFQQGIADRMTVVVVDPFELVEVASAAPASRPCQSLSKPARKSHGSEAVGDAGERVVVRQPLDLLFRAPFLGNVFLNIDPAAIGERLVAQAKVTAQNSAIVCRNHILCRPAYLTQRTVFLPRKGRGRG